MTSRTTFTSLLVLFAGSTIASASCGGSDTKIPPPPKAATSSGVSSGGGDMTATTGVGGAGGMGSTSSAGGAGGTGGMTSCVESSECPGPNTECQTRLCAQGICSFVFAPSGSHLAMQTAGDCKVVVCDGAGATTTQSDDTDPLDDKNPCTDDLCAAGAPISMPSALGTACMGPAAGKVCDGNSTCVECNVNADCASSVCQVNKCVPGSCLDTVKNGMETDVDCGGAACNKCADSKLCSAAGDCASGVCTGGVCKAAICTDAVKNGSETDVDCGGGSCAPCAPNKICAVAADCTSKVCTGGVCKAPSCTDGTLNGSETDTDCGAGCPPCALGQKCNNTNANCSSQVCTGNLCVCPAGMKTVPKSGGNGGTYCIDTTEITNDQYTVFWGSSHSTQNLPGVCASKMSFTPKVGWPRGPSEGALPVRGVDWCDAYAYCDYFGKHLCGKVSGGATTTAEYDDTTKSEWYNACTAQGANDYPYGAVYSNAKCRGVDQSDPDKQAGTCVTVADPNPVNGCAGPVAVNSPQNGTCVGGVPGLLGMSGNVAEWENSCDDAANPSVCHVRGGSHCETGAADVALRCNALSTRPVDYHGCDVGFRCCF